MENVLSGCKMATLIEQQNEFIRRWKAPELVSNSEDEVQQFIIRIMRLFETYSYYRVYIEEICDYANYQLYVNNKELGILFPTIKLQGSAYEQIHNVITESKDFLSFLFKLRLLINTVISFVKYMPYPYEGIEDEKTCLYIRHTDFIEHLKKCFEISNINVKLLLDRTNHPYYFEIDFYPKGDKVLDKTLVDEVLPVLNESSKHEYLQALKCYLDKEYVKSADHLRRTLESWLKETFNLDKTLNNILKNIDKEISKALGSKIETKFGKNTDKTNLQLSYISTFISEAFPSLINLFDKYEIPHNNGGLKHATATVARLMEAELEFMLYQTGAIIRFINNILNIEIIDEE